MGLITFRSASGSDAGFRDQDDDLDVGPQVRPRPGAGRLHLVQVVSSAPRGAFTRCVLDSAAGGPDLQSCFPLVSRNDDAFRQLE